ncbi:peptidoglycan DD-metalloendopeptidase family protein [Fulvimonas sp. R45]|uniref:peptidoglycan DD-metalloendopeptidase family protein n=1 Tax=Fulvimonas sp. R45 TaxID=3045937 RepID=UPI00265E547D|nr:peptidoglycan DD-metalloendopeptidase family protein [Fulvimonas sp. R45]MDO1528640.1 peptidoglycan DD-metalloendopeptidase family protein [Fulvimonas sp. R45]
MKLIRRWLAPVALTGALAGCSTVVVEPAPGAHATVAHATAPARAPGGSYRVVHGDTLYSIAFRNGVDFRDLARWNGIAAPYTIWPGQELRLSQPGAGTAVATTAHHGHPARPASAPPAPAAPVFQTVTPTPATGTSVAKAASPAPAATSIAAPAQPVSTTVPVAGEPVHAALPPVPTPVASTGGSRSVGGVSWHWPASGAVVKRFRGGDSIPGIEIAGKAGDPVRAAADGVVVYSGNGLVGYGELVIIKHNDSFLSAYGHNRKRLVTEGQRVKAGQQIAEMGSTGASRDELEFQIRKDGNPVDPMDYLPSR